MSDGPVTEHARGAEAEQMLTVAEAAALSRRSPRTIRRAYRRGALRAFRDGNGRGVRISHGDLRQWMQAKPVRTDPQHEDLERPRGVVSHRKRQNKSGPSQNLRLLNAARQRAQREPDGALTAGARRRP